MNWIYEPWPWYISGPFIALVMFLLIMLGKNFGVSGNLRTLCTLCGAGKNVTFFKFDWKNQRWNLMVIFGAIIGGFIASNYMTEDLSVDISPTTIERLDELGFENAGATYLPPTLFDTSSLLNIKTLILLALGGLLVGFGTRYAGGCTSGHAISGLSDLQLPSLIAVIGFFIGGLFMIHVLFPILF